MVNDKRYNGSFLGMTKNEVIEYFGEELNFFPDDIWLYEISRKWWGAKTIIFLEFENNKVDTQYIKYVSKKIKRLRKK